MPQGKNKATGRQTRSKEMFITTYREQAEKDPEAFLNTEFKNITQFQYACIALGRAGKQSLLEELKRKHPEYASELKTKKNNTDKEYKKKLNEDVKNDREKYKNVVCKNKYQLTNILAVVRGLGDAELVQIIINNNKALYDQIQLNNKSHKASKKNRLKDDVQNNRKKYENIVCTNIFHLKDILTVVRDLGDTELEETIIRNNANLYEELKQYFRDNEAGRRAAKRREAPKPSAEEIAGKNKKSKLPSLPELNSQDRRTRRDAARVRARARARNTRPTTASLQARMPPLGPGKTVEEQTNNLEIALGLNSTPDSATRRGRVNF